MSEGRIRLDPVEWVIYLHGSRRTPHVHNPASHPANPSLGSRTIRRLSQLRVGAIGDCGGAACGAVGVGFDGAGVMGETDNIYLKSLRNEVVSDLREVAVSLLKDSLVCNGIAQSEKMVRKAIDLLEKAETLEASNASR